MTQLRISELLEKANILLDKGFHLMPGFVTIRNASMENILDRINASIPDDIREAEMILKRRDEIITESQNRADRIIADAKNEAARLLSDNEIMRMVYQEREAIQKQLIEDCEAIQKRAADEADNVRIQAADEAMKMRNGAEDYAEMILNKINSHLIQLQQEVTNGQDYIQQVKVQTRNIALNQANNIMPVNATSMAYNAPQNIEPLDDIFPQENN